MASDTYRDTDELVAEIVSAGGAEALDGLRAATTEIIRRELLCFAVDVRVLACSLGIGLLRPDGP